uniref:Uncharacterized protein n=1 Tax=Rhizophora mucronata TaxID=61149 RepID=A0A2P2Q5I3_RHIMU
MQLKSIQNCKHKFDVEDDTSF